MECWPGDPRRQMTLIGGDGRPVAAFLEHLGECRARMTLSEMTDDAKRHLVQFKKDEASTFGHSLPSAFRRTQPRRIPPLWLWSRTPPRAHRATTSAIGRLPLQFGDTSAIAGTCAGSPE